MVESRFVTVSSAARQGAHLSLRSSSLSFVWYLRDANVTPRRHRWNAGALGVAGVGPDGLAERCLVGHAYERVTSTQYLVAAPLGIDRI